jgi:FMN phosphatase YigB (HAD superfamily)
MKPERLIFELARSQFGVDPSRTLYIDDLEENVRGAESVGFLGHHYDPAQHHLFEERVRELSTGISAE